MLGLFVSGFPGPAKPGCGCKKWTRLNAAKTAAHVSPLTLFPKTILRSSMMSKSLVFAFTRVLDNLVRWLFGLHDDEYLNERARNPRRMKRLVMTR